jgi:UDP-2,3-diacylglucosamine hydrolase
VEGRLGLIAGNGRLPFEVAEAALERGVPLAIVAIERNTDPAIESCPAAAFTWVAAGEIGRVIEFLKNTGSSEVILAGGVNKRELLRDPAALRPDARAIALLTRLRDRGDDALLRAIAAELESEGLPVVDSTRHLGDRLTAEGPMHPGCKLPDPDSPLARDLALGLRVVRAVGALDVGQAVVVKDGTVLAVEAIEGTDEAIRRAHRFGGKGAVVVKAAKPAQDLRFDVPAIGPSTLEVARTCGVQAIGLEAGRTLVLERARTLTLAESCEIAVFGLRSDAT